MTRAEPAGVNRRLAAEVILLVTDHDRPVLVFTALQVEYRAVLEQLEDDIRQVEVGGIAYDVGKLRGSVMEIALGKIRDARYPRDAGVIRAVEFFQPVGVLLVGISNAERDVLELGDVVIATDVVPAEDERSIEVKAIRSSRHYGSRRFQELARVVAAERESVSRYGIDDLSRSPKIHFEAASPAVADPVLQLRQLLVEYQRIVAAEIPAGAQLPAEALQLLDIRGITRHRESKNPAADFAWQETAAINAASFARELVVRLLRDQTPELPQGRAPKEDGENLSRRKWTTPVQLVSLEGSEAIAVVPAWDRGISIPIPIAQIPGDALTALQAGQKPVRGVAAVNLNAESLDELRVENFKLSPPLPSESDVGLATDA